MIFVFLDGARLKLINNPQKSNKFFGHENPNSKISPQAFVYPTFCLQTQPKRPLCRCSKRDGHWRSPSDQRDGRPRRSRSAKKIGVRVATAWLLGEEVVEPWMFSLLDSGSQSLRWWEKGGFSGWLDLLQWLYPWCPLILGMQLPGSISIHQDMPPRDEAARIP